MNNYTYRELQNLARSRSVSAKGSREDIIARLSSFKYNPDTTANYDLFLLKDLKQLLKNRNLKITGNKNELIARLIESDASNSYINLKKYSKDSSYLILSYSNPSKRTEDFYKLLLSQYPDYVQVLSDTELLIKKGPFIHILFDIIDSYGFKKPIINIDWYITSNSTPISNITKKEKSPTKKERSPIKKSPTKKEIKKEIMPTETRLNELSEYFKMDLNKYEIFRGIYLYEWGWLLYLEKLLGNINICTFSKDNSDQPSYIFKKNNLNISQKTIDHIKSCINNQSRFTVGILSLKLPNTIDNHANAIIFDNKYHILTRFEPHGKPNYIIYDHSTIDSFLHDWVKNTFGKEWKYNSTLNICPKPGPQARDSAKHLDIVLKTKKVYGKTVKSESKGFCQVWSLLYIHMRIINPDKTDAEILENILSWSDKDIALNIRKYTEYIVNTIELPNLKVNDVVSFGLPNKNLYGYIVSIKRKNAIVKTQYSTYTVNMKHMFPVTDPSIIDTVNILKESSKQNLVVNPPQKILPDMVVSFESENYTKYGYVLSIKRVNAILIRFDSNNDITVFKYPISHLQNVTEAAIINNITLKYKETIKKLNKLKVGDKIKYISKNKTYIGTIEKIDDTYSVIADIFDKNNNWINKNKINFSKYIMMAVHKIDI